jgi:hypothetical protein
MTSDELPLQNGTKEAGSLGKTLNRADEADDVSSGCIYSHSMMCYWN